jgi:2-succinyl-6-hydroxy-2,4-cyclohexadiene-1-carboxylate synthase
VKWRIVAAVVGAAVVALLVNAWVVDRAERPAAAFGGGRVLDIDGPKLNVREYGAPGDRAVVLLHGYTASIEWWDKVAPTLAGMGQRVIAIDLVGHGGSEKPRDAAQYGLAGQTAAVRRALEALGVHHAVLIGHSMGGHIATALAESDPDLVERIAVVDTYGATGLFEEPALAGADCWPIIGAALDRLRGVHAVTESSLQDGFAPGFPVPDLAYRSLEQLTQHGVCDSNPDEEVNRDRAVADQLAALHKPVLVIWGEHDVLTPTAQNVARFRAAGIEPRIISGAGHSPMVEAPDAFVAAVSDFVAPAPAG